MGFDNFLIFEIRTSPELNSGIDTLPSDCDNFFSAVVLVSLVPLAILAVELLWEEETIENGDQRML